jgi:GNAT superfamily N-acetyltransferase
MHHLVRLTLDEMQYVRHIAYQTWPSTFKEILTPEQIQYMLEWMYNLDTLKQQYYRGQHFYAVKENDTYIGFTAIELNYPEKETVKVHKLYVLPEYQGKGIGRALVNHAHELALGAKMKTILLNVNRFNPAVAFYQKYGFRTLKEEVIDIGNGFIMDDFVMVFEL